MLSRIKLYAKKQFKFKKKSSLITPEALLEATQEKNIENVKYLLKQGVNPNTDYTYNIEEGGVVLHLAVKEQNNQIVKLLLENGANPNSRDNFGDTPLHIAAQKGYTTIVKTLLENGAFVDAQGFCGFTPLEVATLSFSKVNFDIIKMLLQYDAKFVSNIIKSFYKDKTSIVENKELALKALLELEQLFRNKKIYEIAEKTYIKKVHIEDFVKWKAEAELPKYIKIGKALLDQYIYKLFTLNKYLNDNSSLISMEIKKILETKIHEYVGNQDLTETKQPILTLEYLVKFKLMQNSDESKKYFSDTLSLPNIEIIGKLEQEFKINISGIIDQSENLYNEAI